MCVRTYVYVTVLFIYTTYSLRTVNVKGTYSTVPRYFPQAPIFRYRRYPSRKDSRDPLLLLFCCVVQACLHEFHNHTWHGEKK
jgi:hypothetical protein